MKDTNEHAKSKLVEMTTKEYWETARMRNYDEGHRIGYDEGYRLGYNAGHGEGLNEGREAQARDHLLEGQRGAQAFTVEALELVVRLVEVMERQADNTTAP